jgi:hypothetical protein
MPDLTATYYDFRTRTIRTRPLQEITEEDYPYMSTPHAIKIKGLKKLYGLWPYGPREGPPVPKGVFPGWPKGWVD